MLNPFIDLISNVIFLINLALLVWVVLDILIYFDILNRNQPLIARVHSALGKLLEPVLRPIRNLLRKYLPIAGIDLSPIILILLLNFLNNALYTWFYDPTPHERTVIVESSGDRDEYEVERDFD